MAHTARQIWDILGEALGSLAIGSFEHLGEEGKEQIGLHNKSWYGKLKVEPRNQRVRILSVSQDA